MFQVTAANGRGTQQREKKTYNLLNLVGRQAGNAVLGTVGESNDIGLDAGIALAAARLLGGARIVDGALQAVEPVMAPRAVAAVCVWQADGAAAAAGA